ncbi:MAG: sulfatase [Verrucomicrobia bacterium]|nr:sulfatase [Verrucomicrobiota bacterium]
MNSPHKARMTLPKLVLPLLLLTITLSAAEPRPPNFIFILIDDMGWTDLGCFGSTFYKTPNIDKLAASGMKFTNAYAACPVCSPTRASIMTGKYPARLHLTDWLPGRRDMSSQKLLRPQIRQALPLEEVALAEALKSKGYVTAHVGKWHLGGKGFEPQKQGFDLNVAGDHTGTPLSYFHPFQRDGRFMPGLERGEAGEYLTDRLTTEAEKFIEQNRDKPFFLYLAHYAVHIPLRAKQELVAKFQQSQPSPSHTNAIYAAMIASVDESVGRLVRKLEELKLTDNTVIIFTTDNGGLSVKEGPNTPATSNAPLRAGKGYLYEGGIRVPLIVRWPGATHAGGVCRTPVSSVDYYPTILEIARVEPAQGQILDGASLVPLLKQSGEIKRGALFWHYPHYSNQGGKPGGAIREGDFKLVEFYEDGRRELYNLVADIGEQSDLARQSPEKAAALHKKLSDWRRQVNAQMMTSNPDYKPAAAPP